MSETPKTDKFQESYNVRHSYGQSLRVAPIFKFARELERESAALRNLFDSEMNWKRKYEASELKSAQLEDTNAELRKQLESSQEASEVWVRERHPYTNRKVWLSKGVISSSEVGLEADDYPEGTRLIVTARVEGGEG